MQLLRLLSLSSAVSAAALVQPRQACTNPEKRVEFRTLDAAAQKQYTDAVMCLATKPSGLNLGLNTTLYDDFSYVHTHLNKITPDANHLLSPLLRHVPSLAPILRAALPRPAARMRLHRPHGLLGLVLDAADTAHSSIWSLVGGNGGTDKVEKTGTQEWMCLTDGPFKDLRPAYNELEYAPHCLSRDFYDGKNRPGTMRGSAYDAAELKFISERETYADFRLYLESIPHGSIHSAVGGQKGDLKPSSSPNDPLFFCTTPRSTVSDQPPAGGVKSTLDDVMPFMGLAADIKISEVMTTQNDLLCYTY
ncbi:hypothetical protein PG993_000006 [Apiospora rasikravindrae]|uniref:Tyrosinase copper-binding domain-containing protein n=1 Tax=Apiospora rasikravindrae TaxID=990691 RepID=A0ABR1U7C2_9PEZI